MDARLHGKSYSTRKNLALAAKSLSVDGNICGNKRYWLNFPLNKSAWRSRCHDAVTDFEDRRVDSLRSKRARCKAGVLTNPGAWVSDVCSRPCQSRIGLFTHIDNKEIRRIDGSIRRRRRVWWTVICWRWTCPHSTYHKFSVSYFFQKCGLPCDWHSLA